MSYGRVFVDEIRGETPSGDDILLLAKKFMADPEPYKIATVLTASQAADIRRSFAQPQGGPRSPPKFLNVCGKGCCLGKLEPT